MEDDDMRACVPCPFCYVDIQVPAVCLHEQEQHCFDFKNVVLQLLVKLLSVFDMFFIP